MKRVGNGSCGRGVTSVIALRLRKWTTVAVNCSFFHFFFPSSKFLLGRRSHGNHGVAPMGGTVGPCYIRDRLWLPWECATCLSSWKKKCSESSAISWQPREPQFYRFHVKVIHFQGCACSVTKFGEGATAGSLLPNMVLVNGESSGAIQQPGCKDLTVPLQLGLFLPKPPSSTHFFHRCQIHSVVWRLSCLFLLPFPILLQKCFLLIYM